MICHRGDDMLYVIEAMRCDDMLYVIEAMRWMICCMS